MNSFLNHLSLSALPQIAGLFATANPVLPSPYPYPSESSPRLQAIYRSPHNNSRLNRKRDAIQAGQCGSPIVPVKIRVSEPSGSTLSPGSRSLHPVIDACDLFGEAIEAVQREMQILQYNIDASRRGSVPASHIESVIQFNRLMDMMDMMGKYIEWLRGYNAIFSREEFRAALYDNLSLLGSCIDRMINVVEKLESIINQNQ